MTFDKIKSHLFTLSHSPCKVEYSILGFKSKNQDKVN
jgi:myosin heavy subunit